MEAPNCNDCERSMRCVLLQLHLQCSNLPRVGLVKTPPDTSAVVTLMDEPGEWHGHTHEYAVDDNNERNKAATMEMESFQTEVVKKSCHPHYTRVFEFEYEYGTELFFYVIIKRGDEKCNKPHKNDAMLDGKREGPVVLDKKHCDAAMFEVSEILSSKENTKAKRLRRGGAIFAQLRPLSNQSRNENDPQYLFRFQLGATTKFDLQRRFSKTLFHNGPDTLLEIAKQHKASSSAAGHSWITVYRSRPVLNSLQPTWDTAEVDLECCCNGDLELPIRISIWIYKKGTHDVILGTCETTTQNLVDAAKPLPTNPTANSLVYGRQVQGEDARDLVIQRPQQQKMNRRKELEVGRIGVKLAQIVSADEINSERLTTTRQIAELCQRNSSSFSSESDAFVKVLPPPSPGSSPSHSLTSASPHSFVSKPQPPVVPSKPSFQEYVKDGFCDVDFCVAIDFTSSNGDPRIPGTNHYRNDAYLNDYEESIVSIGHAISKFSSSREFSVWGFGAKYGGAVQHIFQCGTSKTVRGIDGVIDAYHSVFRSDLMMSGPTVIVQVLQAAAIRARNLQKQESQSNPRYCVLLILTDGVVNDLAETKRKLETYSTVPLSVIIVGIGRQDFQDMKILSQNSGATASRDNTTFVEFRKYQNDPSLLAAAALANFPNQVVDYMTRHGIYPNKESSRSHTHHT